MMRGLAPVRVIAALFAATTVLGAPYSWATPVFTGPTSPYYVDNFNDHTIYVVQGTGVINSFHWAYGSGCTYCEGSLAVTNVVSTNSFGNDYGSGTEGQYTLSGTPTGKSWPTTPPLTREAYNAFYDGTSDGTHNYTVESRSTASLVCARASCFSSGSISFGRPPGLPDLPF
jgi:hypothetical protein